VVKVRVQEYRRNFYHEQQSARTVPKGNKLVWYLEVNSPYHKRTTRSSSSTTTTTTMAAAVAVAAAATAGLKRRA
jgi:hypothetical protein